MRCPVASSTPATQKNSTARHLQIVPDGLPIAAEKLVTRDFHVHRSFVHQSQAGAIRSDSPHPIVVVPRSFMAKHDQVGVPGGHLKVVGPVVLRVDLTERASLDVDGVEHFRRTRSPVRLKTSALSTGRRSARYRLSVGIGHDAHQHGFVRADGESAATARLGRNLGDLACRVGIQIRSEDGAFLRVVNLAGLMAGHQDAHAPLNHLIDFARRQIDGRDAVRIGDHQLLAISRVGVLMEIQRRSAGLARETNHAMSGVRVDPFRRERACADTIRVAAAARNRILRISPSTSPIL